MTSIWSINYDEIITKKNLIMKIMNRNNYEKKLNYE